MHTFIEAAKRIYEDAKKEGRLKEGLSLGEIKTIAERQDGVVKTQFGSLAADSEPNSRSAPHTKNSVDNEFGEEEDHLAKRAVEALGKEILISTDVIVGDGSEGITTRFLLPKRYAQIAYGMKLLFGEPENKVVEKPVYHIIFFTDDAFESNKRKPLKQKDIEVRLYMGENVGEQVKICRNTMYVGEGKKGVFMFEDWRVKALSKTGIFLHAGARKDKLWIYNKEEQKWEFKTIVTAISGLTATGKTTTLCRNFARYPGESSEMIGDDGGEFRLDGSYVNFELGGVYIKTDGLSNEEQPEIYRGAVGRDAFLENIALTKYPYMPDFHDTVKTTNSRAIIARKNIEIASPSIRAEKVDNIIILTRNPLVNVISKLTPEQATMQFIYGESVESSGGDPLKAGQFKREFFLDPFVAGNLLEHAMAFYKFLKSNPRIRCYLANTDVVGQERVIKDPEMYEKVLKRDRELISCYESLGLILGIKEGTKDVYFTRNVSLRQSLAAYNDVLRGQIKFSNDPDHLGYYYPIQCDRLNKSVAVAGYLFSDKVLLKKRVAEFLEGRRKYIEQFEKKWGNIPDKIRNSLPPYSNGA